MAAFPKTLQSLNIATIDSDVIRKTFGTDNRYIEAALQRLINVNKRSFDFLGIKSRIIPVGHKYALQLETSKYVGSIPIFSPHNGKHAFDLNVIGRYNEEIEPLLSLINDSISPEYSDELRLTKECQQKPPIFIECCKFVDKYIEADRFRWHKFSNVIKTEKEPKTSTLWYEYVLRTYANPIEFNIFKNKCNIISRDHREWRQLNYVLEYAIEILNGNKIPIKTQIAYRNKIVLLRTKLKVQRTEKTNSIIQRTSDPHIIKDLKTLANIILSASTNERMAWRIDYAVFFERYVQYLFTAVAKSKGADCHCNPHYVIKGKNRPKWALAYLEPDIVLQKGNEQYIIDAKYKSHIFNWNDYSDELHEIFRHDLHQILAYSSFNQSATKNVILVYPFSKFDKHELYINSSLIHAETNVLLVGIPLKKTELDNTRIKLSELLTI